MFEATVVAKIPVGDDPGFFGDLQEAALSGDRGAFNGVMSYQGGPKLARIRQMGEAHGALFDGTGSDGKTLDVFFYAKATGAEALAEALLAEGITAVVRHHGEG